MRSHASSVMSVNDSNSSKPALVTMISIGPSSPRTFAIASSTAARSVTSTGRPERAPAPARELLGRPPGGVAVEIEQRDPVPGRGEALAPRRAPCPMRRR